jgi:hypothetical protein
MSAAPRTVSSAPDFRQLALALGAVLVAVAIVAVVALARPASIKAPSISTTPVSQFDHGTSSGTSSSDSLNVSGTRPGGIQYVPYQAVHKTTLTIQGTKGGGVIYMGIPSGAVQKTITVQGTHGGGIEYRGIPYTTTDSTPSNGGRGTRFEQ